MKKLLTLFGWISLLLVEIQSLKVMELMAPYRILNVGNGKFLTTVEQGIIGLRTGIVATTPYEGKDATHQQWTLAWDPSIDDKHDGYRIESRKEYLNEVTAFYPDGRTTAMPKIWEIIELPDNVKILRNKRSQKCLQVFASRVEVYERTCSFKNRFQHWKLERLDLDKRINEKI